jgi:hypothetical protein
MSYQTLQQVADELHFTPRRLRAIIKRHGVPVLKDGRDIRFDQVARSALDEALRCPSKSPDAKTPARSPSAARSPANAFASALSLTTVSSRRRR